ncbi:MAG: hypothetical protein RBT51_06505, partial [Ectothiorhodospiraceae bacterium]|nr:hypothetical protein [Ectothiorhodospiraceae bacterium]
QPATHLLPVFGVLLAERRYLRFIEDFRDIADRIPQKDIASYVRITPVALSRIKARLRRRSA